MARKRVTKMALQPTSIVQADTPIVAAGKLPTPASLFATARTGRQTQPSNLNILPTPGTVFVPRRTSGMQMTDLLNYVPYAAYNPSQMLNWLADLSPDVSLAVWNMVRMVGRGMKVEVRTLANDSGDAEGQAIADQLTERINSYSGGMSGLISTAIFSLYVEGRLGLEVVPEVIGDRITGVADWFIANTNSIWASLASDDYQRPVYYQLRYSLAGTAAPLSGKLNNGSTSPSYTRLNPELFFYVGMDNAPDDVYGRSPILPVLGHIFTDIQLMQDLGRWVHINAWPRMAISIDGQMLADIIPEHVKADPIAYGDWIGQVMADAKDSVENLNPDDTYIGPAYAKPAPLNIGGTGAGSLAETAKLVQEKIARGLKMPGTLMGMNTGNTETYSTVEWEVFADGVEALQEKLAYILERAYSVSLRLYGYAAKVEVSFEHVRASDRYRDAQSEQLEIANEIAKRNEGWVTQDEAAIAVTGTGAIDEADRYINPNTPPQLMPDNNQQQNIPPNEHQAGDNTKDNPNGDKAQGIDKDATPRSPRRIYIRRPVDYPQISTYVESEMATALDNYFSTLASSTAANPTEDDKHRAYLLLLALLRGAYQAVYTPVGDDMAKGLGGMFIATPQEIDELARTRAKLINDSTWDKVTTAIENGKAPGEAISQMKDSRSGIIAATEVAFITRLAEVSAMKQNGVQQVQWQRTRSEPEPICDDNNGQIVSLGTAFNSGDTQPPAHPDCYCILQPVGRGR